MSSAKEPRAVSVTTSTAGEESVRVETRGSQIEELLGKEWLLSNERGSFAASTIAACPTSSYHGLLIGSPEPLVRRVMALSNCLETMQTEGQTVELSTLEFPDCFAPQGYAYLEEFRRDAGVHFVFRAGPVELCKSIYLARKRDTVVVEYAFLRVDGPLDFAVRPFVGMRDLHGVQKSDAPLACRTAGRRVAICNARLSDCELLLGGAGMKFHHDPQWWFNFVYRANRSRGQPPAEDLWAPGFFYAHLDQPGRVAFWAHLRGTGGPARRGPVGADTIRAELLRHQTGLIARAGATEKTHGTLCLAADQFIVKRRRDGHPRTTVVAGYPWFVDWGRDALLSLPGLLLATGRHAEAGEVLSTFAAALDQGMIPNRFDDRTGTAEFNSVDASLWFIHAAFEYLAATQNTGPGAEGAGRPSAEAGVGPRLPVPQNRDSELLPVSPSKSGQRLLRARPGGDARGVFMKRLLPAIRAIIDAYGAGTRFGIHADSDGLISAGDEHTQLTWMDALCDGIAFTPRHGKAVEVNALWHNALCLMQRFCERQQRPSRGGVQALRPAGTLPTGASGRPRRDGKPQREVMRKGPRDALAAEARRYAALAQQVGVSFCERFWNVRAGYLNDTILPDGTVDARLRPNQIFAVSLPFAPPLARSQQRSIVSAVERELLTPYGPRTLSRRDPAYRGRYEGTLRQRDEAYHQGTVWPYLMGPFVEAYLKIHNHSKEAHAYAAELIRPLLRHLVEDACLASISEVFDGDAPHRPGGCWAQAWSVAELLRIYRVVTPG
jgi:glycogen debranching enzyme